MGDGNRVSPSDRSSVLFSSSSSLWAVLHMPEEREQRIHYVRLSQFTQVIGRRDSGKLGGGGCACSLVVGEREVPRAGVRAWCFVRGAGFVFARVFPVA